MSTISVKRKKIRSGEVGMSGNWIVHIVLLLGSAVMILPFLFMILTAFKTRPETIAVPPVIFPQQLFEQAFGADGKGFMHIFENFSFAMSKIPNFSIAYFNTFAMMAICITCAAVFSSMAAYGFAKMHFPLKNFFFSTVVIQLMLPPQVFIMYQYRMVIALGWKNTIMALAFPGLVSAFGVFFMRQFYMSLPNDLSEAARLDGCNHFQIFTLIMVPLTKTALMALSIFTALFAWSNLMWPLIVNTREESWTLSVVLANLDQMAPRGVGPHHYMSIALLAMAPMVVLYMFFQKQFIEGIALTGTKA